jgi:hypothetical protein
MDKAAQAVIDLGCRAKLRLRGDDDVTDIVITDDVARADDHGYYDPKIRP